jgi:biopolymer transport protein ExbB/TolQ
MAEFMGASWEVWLIFARAFVLLAAFAAFGWALMRMRREASDQLERVQGAQRDLAAQTQALSERVAALATLVASLPRQAEPVSEPPRAVAPRRDTGVRSYETAKRLARSGASVEEIVATCGVPGTEARLLRRLHGGEPRRDNAA